MAKRLYALIPDAERLLALEPEELASIVLEMLNSCTRDEANSILNRANFINYHIVEEYDRKYWDSILHALMEAWVWLEREGLIAPRPRDTGAWVFITRRGERLKGAADFSGYRSADILPRNLLHPVIALKVWSAFLRGDWDIAVFQAFKEVEVAVRQAGGFALTDYGVTLMREAFHPEKGPLADKELPEPERIATRELFSGALGLLKNPHSHRKVDMQDPRVEAVEAIMLASYLMRIVDARQSLIGHDE